jgi:hypothetical protein
MPDSAENAYPILFGDFSRGYLVHDRIGIEVLVDPFSSKSTEHGGIHGPTSGRWTGGHPRSDSETENRGFLASTRYRKGPLWGLGQWLVACPPRVPHCNQTNRPTDNRNAHVLDALPNAE